MLRHKTDISTVYFYSPYTLPYLSVAVYS
uniref:Uncharacterized protein n=1 Tax=Anguilla anguilla TaxID=7936 RepID=A0A0E9SWW5_ANGAN